jgi:hypothetical protein
MGNWRIWVLVISISAFLTLNAEKDAISSPFLFPAPPPVVVIPGTYVYVVPDIDISVLFYRGYWYCPQGKRWFRASHYDGPWMRIPPGHVPRALVKLSPHFRRVPPGRYRISHQELKANWGEWERKKYWNDDKDWQAGLKGKEGKYR